LDLTLDLTPKEGCSTAPLKTQRQGDDVRSTSTHQPRILGRKAASRINCTHIDPILGRKSASRINCAHIDPILGRKSASRINCAHIDLAPSAELSPGAPNRAKMSLGAQFGASQGAFAPRYPSLPIVTHRYPSLPIVTPSLPIVTPSLPTCLGLNLGLPRVHFAPRSPNRAK
jgi:hypothetical protein